MKTILLDANMQQQLPKGGLAIDGGQCVRTRKFAPWPSLSEDEVEALSAVLRSGKLNYCTGEEVRQFEAEFASFAYYVFLRPELKRKAWNRDQLLQAIAAEGIPCFSGSCSEIYLDGWRDASNKVGHLRRAQ